MRSVNKPPSPALASLTFLASLLLVNSYVAGDDAVVADPGHYDTELEDGNARVIRITYGPRERSVMHEHGAGVVVFLTDSFFRFRYPDGSMQETEAPAGTALFAPAEEHLPENLLDTPAELVYVEFKD